jgi:carbonic anhydrase
MKPYELLLENNEKWAAGKINTDPDFFKRLSDIQTPEFLWIVHRNVANLVIHTDVNLLSVLEYAVVHLKVEHIIVCGHYGCGGVKAAMGNTDYNQVLNMWLRNIKDVYRQNREELDTISNETERANRLVELNVKEQTQRLAKTSIVQKAWKQRGAPDLHGWVYSLQDGIIHPVFEMKAGSDIDPLYRFDI